MRFPGWSCSRDQAAFSKPPASQAKRRTNLRRVFRHAFKNIGKAMQLRCLWRQRRALDEHQAPR